MRFCPPPKNCRIFVREDWSFVKRCSSINRKKMENRERNKSCNSIWLEAKACFWSLLKIFLFVLAPLAHQQHHSSMREEKKKFCHPQMIQNFIDWASRSRRGYYVMHSVKCRNFCTENALCFPSKCASESSSILQWTKDTLARFERYQSLLSAIPAAISMKQIKKLSGLCKSIILPKSHWIR